jgi:hypothetical protein
VAGFGGGAHGEFVHVCFADDYAVLLFDSGDDFCVIGRNKIFEHQRRTGCGYSFGADGVFDCDGDSCQFADRFSFCDFLVDLFCFFEGFLLDEGDVGVDCWFMFVDCFEDGVDAFLGCGFVALYFLDGFVGC